MKLSAETTKAIRKAAGCKNVELPERDGQFNMLLCEEGADVGDWHPMRAGFEVEDVLGLVELDLYLRKPRGFVGNKTVWVFDDGRGNQHVYTDSKKVPGEFERAIRRAAAVVLK